MARAIRWFLIALLCVTVPAAWAGSGKIYKVLPLFLDQEGRYTVSPSLYDRDAYQADLRLHPAKRSGMRYDIHWKFKGKTKGPLLLRVELRGVAKGDLPKQLALEQNVNPTRWYGAWTALQLVGDSYRDFGEVTAWRATLWDGDVLVSSQQSFLW